MSERDAQGVGAAWRTAAWLFLALLFLYRWLWLYNSGLPLFFDEAYYLGWSRELDWGYYSKPPVVAWLIRAMTELFGDSEVVIKSTGMLLYSMAAVIVYLLGRDLYDEQTGLWSAIAYASMPFVAMQSMFTAPDAPLIFFWALALWFTVRADRSDQGFWWVLAGLAVGLGMLSKYAMGFLVAGVLVFLLTDRDRRRHLARPGLWVGLVLAAGLMASNVWWNAQYDFITVQHHAEIAAWDRDLFNFGSLAVFWVWQLGIMGPVFIVALIRVFWQRRAFDTAAARLLSMASLPVLVVVSLQAFLARAYQNWAVAAYVGFIVLVVAWLLRTGRRGVLVAGIAINVGGLAVFYHYHALTDALGIELTSRMDPYRRLLGWREMGREITPWRQRYPDARLLSNSRRVIALMSYYAEPRYPEVAGWVRNGWIDDHYQLRYDVARFPDAEFLFLASTAMDDTLRASFRQVMPLGRREVKVYPDFSRVLYGYWLQGFTGYPESR